MWATLASLLTGPIISGAIGAYKARLEAGNTKERIEADLAEKGLLLDQKERELATQVNLADEGRWWTVLPRQLINYSVALFIVKCIVWDNMMGLGNTDPLAGDMANVFGLVVGFFYGGRTIEKVARIIRGR